jgi:hypothetical protein
MSMRSKGLADGTDTGPAASSDGDVGAPDDRPSPLLPFDATAGGGSSVSGSDRVSTDRGGPTGGGPGSESSSAATREGDALPSIGQGAGDPLAAFLDGLHGLSSLADGGVSSSLPVIPPATMLSNGLNADAGVAQLVSALASIPDGHSSYFATPFTAPSDQAAHGIIAPAAS